MYIYIYIFTNILQVREEYESNKSLMEKELEELRGKVSNMAETKETKDAENAEIKRQMEELSEQLSSVTEIKYVFVYSNTF